MSLLFVEGFDHLDHDFWKTSYSGYKWDLTDYGDDVSSDFPVGWLGLGKCLEMLGDNQYSGCYSRSVPESATIIVGFAHKSSDPLTMADYYLSLVRFRRGGVTQVDLALDGNGYLVVRRGGSTILGTSSRRFPCGAWLYIEFKATVHDTTGSYEVRVDGETVCSGSGVDTKYHADDANITTVAFGKDGSGAYKTWLDDIYCCDTSGSVNNDFLGGSQIHTLKPDGNGAYHQWDPDTTNNYTYVDETILLTSDTDAVTTSTDNEMDAYTFTTLPSTPSAVRGVQLNVVGKRTSIQNRNIQLLTRVSGTDYMSATMAMHSVDHCHTHMMETNPNGGAAWTKAVIDDVQFGMKAV